MQQTWKHYVKFVLGIILVSVGVAMTYTVFEEGLTYALDVVWHDWLHTDERRYMILPIIFGYTALFFWLQHVLDAREEAHESHGLGSMPSPTVANYTKTLLIGFFSLLAGASLGPEAVLVPACMILGAYIGQRVFRGRKRETSLLAGVGIIALFTAFFHSVLVGILTVLLVKKQLKLSLTPKLIAVSVLTSFLTFFTLEHIEAESSFTLPSYDWHISFNTIAWSLLLVAAGYAIIRLLAWLHDQFRRLYNLTRPRDWWLHALVAASGLSILYLIGGPLTQFTGNHSIAPLLEQAPALGLGGLVLIAVIKAAAMAWSKAMGYRGGMIFPTVFLAATFVALVQLYVADFNAIYGLIAVMSGAFIANTRSGVLA